jgi:hypothetical protein
MGDEMEGEKLVKRAKLVLAVREYRVEKTRRREGKMDFTVSSPESDDRILMRVITEPESKSGCVGVDTVRKMSRTLSRRHYEKGILIGKRFTMAAKSEMKREDIEAISERIPRFKLEQLYLVIQNHVDNLCKAKCGKIPKEVTDCKGYAYGQYSCDIRRINDNANFHFERGWRNPLRRDLVKLLAIEEDLNN